MPAKTARCWMLPFHPKAQKAGHGFQTVIPAKERVKKSKLQTSARLRSVIPAKAGIHFSH